MTPIKDALEPFARIPLAHTDDIDDGATVFEYEGGSITLGDLRRVHEALATLTTPVPGRDALRERIARIIDPTAFEKWDNAQGSWRKDEAKAACWDAEEKADAILSALPVAPVVDEAISPMIDAGVAFALNVSLSGEYRWSQYVADLYKTMRKAAIRAEGGER